MYLPHHAWQDPDEVYEEEMIYAFEHRFDSSVEQEPVLDESEYYAWVEEQAKKRRKRNDTANGNQELPKP
jgi:hypothetical protein